MGDSITASAISMTRSLLLVFLGFQLFTLGSTGIWRNEDAQMESASRCILHSASGVDMSNFTAAAAIAATLGRCLLCNLHGSNSNKAIRIRNLIPESPQFDEQDHFIVYVSDYSGGNYSYSFHPRTASGFLPYHGICGSLLIWMRKDNLFTKRSCSSSERSRMTTLMRSAALGGGSNIDVGDRLMGEMENFGYSYHYTSVRSSVDSGFEGAHVYSSCWVQFRGAQHKISVYID